MNSFWWGRDKSKGNGINWAAWDSLCEPKMHGDLAFKNLHNHNLALVAKHAWRLLSRSQSLTARIFKAKYYPTRRLIDVKIGANTSYIWQSIHGTLCLINEGLRRSIGLGKSIEVWTDPWLHHPQAPHVQTCPWQGLESAKVHSLITTKGRA